MPDTFPILYDVARVAGWGGTRIVTRMISYAHVCWVGSGYYSDTAQPLTTTGEKVDDLDHDLSEVC